MKYDNFKDAILNQDVEAVKDLCANGSDINERYDDNQTPLHLAAQIPETEMCRLLIDAGADIKAIDDKNFTPLVSACFRINLGAVQMLIDAGADVNVFTTSYDCFLNDFSCRDEIINNYSPLEHALCSHNGVGGYPEISEIANLLVNAGLDINALDSIGYSALMRSFTSPGNSWIIADELISLGADVNIQAPNGSTALLMACEDLEYGHSAVACKLLDAGANPNVRNNAGNTPLILACQYCYDDPKVIKKLITLGADVNASNAKGLTPLMLYCRYGDGDLNFIKEFASHGADMNAKDAMGKTAIMYACLNDRNSPDFFDVLLGCGTDVNAQDPEGFTPICYFDYVKHHDFAVTTAFQLIRQGAKINNIQISTDMTPGDYIKRNFPDEYHQINDMVASYLSIERENAGLSDDTLPEW